MTTPNLEGKVLEFIYQGSTYEVGVIEDRGEALWTFVLYREEMSSVHEFIVNEVKHEIKGTKSMSSSLVEAACLRAKNEYPESWPRFNIDSMYLLAQKSEIKKQKEIVPESLSVTYDSYEDESSSEDY